MRNLVIGALTIPYELQRSSIAKRAKITVTPDGMAVVVPEASTDDDVERVLRAKRRWIVETRSKMAEVEASRHRVARFGNGAKIPYRGRMARLHLAPGNDSLVQVTYRNGFHILVPTCLEEASVDAQVETALRLWLRRRVRDDAQAIAKRYASRLSVEPSGVHIKDLKHMWGSCGADRSINLDWRLVFAPVAVLEYAILHEMAHLKQRNHGPAFWAVVRTQMPDFESRMIWLRNNEHLLEYSRLECCPEPFKAA